MEYDNCMLFDEWEAPTPISFIDFGVEEFAEAYNIQNLEEILQELTDQWIDDVMNSSSSDEVFAHASLSKIIEIGAPALPFIFNDLLKAPKPWFYALRRITGESPIIKDDAGDFAAMLDTWINWGRSNGYI